MCTDGFHGLVFGNFDICATRNDYGDAPASYDGTAIAAARHSRCHLTTDTSFFSDASPSATGVTADGEVEDGILDLNPTAVTIGKVDLESVDVDEFLAGRNEDLRRTLLESFDPNMAGQIPTH